MQKKLKYMNILYTQKDEAYIDDMVVYLENVSKEIVDFFGIKSFGNKITVKLWDDVSKYRERNFEIYPESAKSVEDVPRWSCGFAYLDNDKINVETLCLEEYRKTQGHEKAMVTELQHLILHEFTHAVHLKINYNCYRWLREGLATTISHQCDNYGLVFNSTLEQTKGGSFVNYINYHTMFCYVYETYGRDYILELINNFELQKQDTERLYNETVEYVKNKIK